MRIGKYEFGIVTFKAGKPQFKLRKLKGACGCILYDYYRFYFTILAGDCLE